MLDFLFFLLFGFGYRPVNPIITSSRRR